MKNFSLVIEYIPKFRKNQLGDNVKNKRIFFYKKKHNGERILQLYFIIIHYCPYSLSKNRFL